MGMFATVIDVYYGYDGPGCSECRGRGWLESAHCLQPGHTHGMMVWMEGKTRVVDSCTFACPCGYDPTEVEEPEPDTVNWHPEEDWTPSYFQLREESVGRGLLELTAREALHKQLENDSLDRATHRGQVSSDVPVTGWCDQADAMATVPPYLKGDVIEVTEGYETVVRYTYLSSTITVRFDMLERDKLRFAHPWDEEFSISTLMA